MADCLLKYLDVGKGVGARSIAARVRAGAAPGLLWLGGFKSDMQGTKAQALDRWAEDQGRAMVRFDYSGHGESGGVVEIAEVYGRRAAHDVIGRSREDYAEHFGSLALLLADSLRADAV